MRKSVAACLSFGTLGLISFVVYGQLNKERGNGPYGVPQLTFFLARNPIS